MSSYERIYLLKTENFTFFTFFNKIPIVFIDLGLYWWASKNWFFFAFSFRVYPLTTMDRVLARLKHKWVSIIYSWRSLTPQCYVQVCVQPPGVRPGRHSRDLPVSHYILQVEDIGLWQGTLYSTVTHTTESLYIQLWVNAFTFTHSLYSTLTNRTEMLYTAIF